MIAFSFGFAKFAVTMLLFTVFGIGAIIGSVLLFVVAPLAVYIRDGYDIKQSWATPTYEK